VRARRSDWDSSRPIRPDQATRKGRPREHAARLVALLILASPTDSEGFLRCRPDANATCDIHDRYRATIRTHREYRVNRARKGIPHLKLRSPAEVSCRV
jgi:hypothetical protein